MKTKTIELFTFDELSETAKQNAIKQLWDINIDYEWYECTIEEFKDQLYFAGFSNIKIDFSGFYSQGDGLSFTGDFNNKNINKKADIYYQSIKDFLQYIEHKHCYFNIERISSRYSHENTVYSDNEYMLGYCRSIMQEFYRALENEYEYLTSEAQIIESIDYNNYYFTEDGELE